MTTLLEKAKGIKTNLDRNEVVTKEEYELATAWANGEISLRQIKNVMGFNNVNSAYIFLSKCFKHSILNVEL